MSANSFPADAVALDELLGGLARGLGSAQAEMNRAAFERSEQSVALPEGEIRLRPLWFVFKRTTFDLELSTFTSEVSADSVALKVRPLDPLAVALRGRASATGARLHIEIAPFGSELITSDR
jgi:hypothetical protein